jgi:C4-dicarboxylate-specific signal transduction histidine kinase
MPFNWTPKLWTLLSLTLGVAVLFSNALLWHFGQQRQSESLRQAYYERIYWIAQTVGGTSTQWIATNNWAQLALSGVGKLKRESVVVYVFMRRLDGEIMAAVDEELVEGYDPQIVAWKDDSSVALEERHRQGGLYVAYSGSYKLREQVLLADAVVDDEVRARQGEVVLEAEQRLNYFGDPVGILTIGFSQKPLTTALEESQNALLLLELGMLALGLVMAMSVAWLVATPLQRMTQRLSQLSTSHGASLEKLEQQLLALGLDEIPANTYESRQLLEAFRNMQRELLVHIQQVRRSSEDLRASNAELQKINLELQATQDRLVQSTKMATMGEMLAMIAHQWRQPLSTISVVAASLYLHGKLGKQAGDAQLQDLQKIMDTTQFLSKTIDDFRNFFRPDKERESVRLQDLTKKALDMVEITYRAQGIRVVEDYRELPPLALYPNELQQVLLNLLKNAQEALTDNEVPDKQVALRLFQDTDGSQILEVHDNAGGVPSEIAERIFHPYFSTKGKLNGTGLGLYMSKMIVEDHLHGQLRVENRDGGACFRMRLNPLPTPNASG